MRAVIDTNVWVSALLTPEGRTGGVVEGVLRDDFTAVWSPVTVDESRAVVMKPSIVRRIGARFASINWLLAALTELGEMIPDPPVAAISRDPNDDVFIALAIDGRADCLVTGDDDLLEDPDVEAHLAAAGVRLLSVAEFLTVLDAPE